MASMKFVVSDRLHARIFAAITDTFDNNNHKVWGGYQWLKNLSHIKFCDSAEAFDQAFQSLDLDSKSSHQNAGLEDAFEHLRQAVQR